MAIEAHVVMLQNKLKNFFQTKRIILCGSRKNDEDARKKLKAIYEFLMKEECQQSKEYDSWKKRLRNGMDKIEDEIDTYLYNVAAQRQRKVKVVADSWVMLKNKMRLQRAMQDFFKTIQWLSKDQYLVDCRAGDDDNGDVDGRTQTQIKICNWSEISGTIDFDFDTPLEHTITSKTSKEKMQTSEVESREPEDGTSRTRTTMTTQDQGKQKLVEQLRAASSGEFEVSVVWGPDGVGKSAITRAVSNLRGIKGGFQWQVWVQMHKQMSYKQLLLRILNQVTHWVPMNPEDMPFQELTKLVYQQLVRNTVLIVLEDVDDFQTLFQFLRGLIDSVSGSHIIITTKNKEAEYLVDEPIRLEPLPKPFNSLTLFSKTLDKPELKLTGDDKTAMRNSVEMSCAGLPLKISLLDKLLSNINAQHWRSLFVDKQNRSIELDVYKLCYNKLPPHLKPCFLYLCLFPKSFPILIRRILRLWSAEDLIIHPPHKDIQTMPNGTQLEDIAESYLLEMVRRNLVEVVRWNSDGSPNAVQMNSNLYDAFLPVAASTGLVDVYGLKKKNEEGIEYVRWYVEPEYRVVEENMKPDLDLLSENVKLGCPRSFVSFRSRKGILANDVGRFVKMLTSKRNLRLLRVLDLEGVYKPYLGNSLHKLLLLRYLGLRSTGLDSLPNDVGALPYLETLDIKHTNINKLPESTWKMARIRHLNLNGFHFNETKLGQFSRAAFISTLTTLTGFHVACRIDERVFELLSRLTKLTKLGVYFHNPLESEMTKIAKWIEKLTALRYLKLGITGRTTSSTSNQKNNDDPKTMTTNPTPQGQVLLLPDLSNHKNLFRIFLLGKLQKFDAAAEKLPGHIKVLTLSMSNLEHDPMRSLGAPSKFLNLIELRLFADCYYNKANKKMTCPRNSFPNLKVLKLWKLTSLEEIVPEDGSLKNLELLEIRYCPLLVKNIFKLAKKLLAQKTKLKELIMFSNPPQKDVARKIEDELKLCAREYNSSEEAVSAYVE